MFREKPYTQCFECIQGNKLKCKRCMANLVSNILKERSALATPQEKDGKTLNQTKRVLKERDNQHHMRKT